MKSEPGLVIVHSHCQFATVLLSFNNGLSGESNGHLDDSVCPGSICVHPILTSKGLKTVSSNLAQDCSGCPRNHRLQNEHVTV